MKIGERIKQRRLELGYTADMLAKMLNKNRATIYRYENGDIENMPIDVLEPLAKALNTTPASFETKKQIIHKGECYIGCKFDLL